MKNITSKKNINSKIQVIIITLMISLMAVSQIPTVFTYASNKQLNTRVAATNKKTSINTNTNVTNNGGNYVKYQDNIYYWEYTAKSFDKTGLFATFQPKYNSTNKMIRKDKNGKKDVMFSTSGYGNIYIYKNRLFLEDINKAGENIIYSVDMNGKNRKEHGVGSMKAIDDKNGIIVLHDKEHKLVVLNCVTGEKKAICESGNFLSLSNSTIYYQDYIKNGKQVIGGEVQLKSISTNGKNPKLIIRTVPDSYDKEYKDVLYNIVQFEKNGDELFFSYGFYAGTGIQYQGGRIVQVNEKKNTHIILAGDKGKWVEEKFYLMDNKSGKSLIYGDYDMNKAISLKTHKVSKTAITPHEILIPFQEGDNIYVYLDHKGTKTKLIEKSDYIEINKNANLQQGYDETYLNIDKIERIDNHILYKVEYSKHYPKEDIGWRYAYSRIKTNYYQKDMKTSNKVLLFTY